MERSRSSKPAAERTLDDYPPLVLLVGPEGPVRGRLAGALIARDHSVVMCPGPPPCPFLSGHRCELSTSADVVVFLRTTPPKGAVGTGLIRCGAAARRVVVAGRAARRPIVEADVAIASSDPNKIMTAIRSALEAPPARRAHT